MIPKTLLALHEAIVVVLINKPGRTARIEEITKYIKERSLYSEAKNDASLGDLVENCLPPVNENHEDLFVWLGDGFIRLRDMEIDFPLRLWNALESLLDYDKKFYNPDLKLLSVVQISGNSKETIKIEVSPANIVCIESAEKSRKKNIYVLEKNQTDKDIIKRYLFNNNKYNFEKLSDYQDPAKKFLMVVSKSAIVNVAFYDLIEKNLLLFNGVSNKSNPPLQIKITGRKEAQRIVRDFKLIQDAYKRRILLQKAAIGYKTDMGF